MKANGEVRLRSVLSRISVGMCDMPLILNMFFAEKTMAASLRLASSLSSTAEICAPRKVEMMAGGASFAPRRWAFVALMIDALSTPACLYTAAMTLTRKVMNCRFSDGVLPGLSRLTPVSGPIDQLLCLPEPFTPLKGFSCSSTRKLWRRAILFMMVINNWLWSLARFVSS